MWLFEPRGCCRSWHQGSCVHSAWVMGDGGVLRAGVHNRPPPQPRNRQQRATTTNRRSCSSGVVSNFLTVFAELRGFARAVTLFVAGIRGSVRV